MILFIFSYFVTISIQGVFSQLLFPCYDRTGDAILHQLIKMSQVETHTFARFPKPYQDQNSLGIKAVLVLSLLLTELYKYPHNEEYLSNPVATTIL